MNQLLLLWIMLSKNDHCMDKSKEENESNDMESTGQ